jgi:hypothetical protein
MAQAKASTTFGTILQIENTDTDEAATGYVDAVSLKIYYSGSGTATPTNTGTATRTNTPTSTRTGTPTKTATSAPTSTPHRGYEGNISVYAIPINTTMTRNATYRIGPPLGDGDCITQVVCAMNVDDASAQWALGTTASDEAYLTDKALSSGITNGVCVDATYPAGTPVFKIKAAAVTTGDGTCWITVLRHKQLQPTPTATNTQIPG